MSRRIGRCSCCQLRKQRKDNRSCARPSPSFYATGMSANSRLSQYASNACLRRQKLGRNYILIKNVKLLFYFCLFTFTFCLSSPSSLERDGSRENFRHGAYARERLLFLLPALLALFSTPAEHGIFISHRLRLVLVLRQLCPDCGRRQTGRCQNQ